MITDFTQNMLPIINTIVAILGLLFIWHQIRLARKAFEQTSLWNKINATYNFVDIAKLACIQRELQEAGRDISIEFKCKLTKRELDVLIKNTECLTKAKELLNQYEYLCCAYQVGALDKNLAFHLYGPIIIKWFDVFTPLVSFWRKEFHDEGILVEIEKTAIEWSARINIETKNALRKGTSQKDDL